MNSNQLKSFFNVLINIKQLLLSFSISFINENQLGDTIENIDDIDALKMPYKCSESLLS